MAEGEMSDEERAALEKRAYELLYAFPDRTYYLLPAASVFLISVLLIFGPTVGAAVGVGTVAGVIVWFLWQYWLLQVAIETDPTLLFGFIERMERMYRWARRSFWAVVLLPVLAALVLFVLLWVRVLLR